VSKRTSPTVIGAFVIGAVALMALGVMLFGGTEIFSRKAQYVAYFPGSVKGLREGSNVLFRGVRIGYVREITLLGDIRTLDTRIQVTMEIFPDQFLLTRDGEVVGPASAGFIATADLIEAGLRAQLGVESFVTGQLVVELDLTPEQPAVFRGVNPPHAEIPSVPSNIQQVLERAQRFLSELQENVDIEAIASEIQQTVSGLNRLVNSGDADAALAGLRDLLTAEDTRQVAADLRRTMADLRTTLADTRRLVQTADARIGPLVAELQPAITQLERTLAVGEDTLQAAVAQLEGDSELAYEAVSTLEEVQDAARALRIFLDYIERNPEALLRGRKRP